jgi:hypothetical protein
MAPLGVPAAHWHETECCRFAYDNAAWRAAYEDAFMKMITTRAYYAVNAFEITGRECPSGWISKLRSVDALTCETACPDVTKPCPNGCICKTGFYDGFANIGGEVVSVPQDGGCAGLLAPTRCCHRQQVLPS